ncbi:MAG: C4-dicarboxylate ABC transporter substrate-binding protein [Rhodospirillaceae bacterium]|nr:C4-dicarboxylate ABC transporter substrate-binding protein [Rhodospirillaceae bacterium]
MAIALALLALPLSAANATTLRVTLQLPITAPFGQNLLFFKDRVEQASGGDITVEIYPNAQLYTDKEVPAAVATGQIEMGVAFTNRLAGLIPAIEVFSVPFLFDTQERVFAATAQGSPVRGPLDEAMTARGMRPLWWQPYGFAIIMADTPVRRPEDLKGLKIRTFGKAYEQLISSLGGAATNIPGSEQYLAYERGTVDGGMTGVMGVKDRKLYQVLETITDANVAAIEAVVLINERVWQGLDADEQKIVAEAAAAAEADINAKIGSILADSIAAAEEGGMEVVRLTDADRTAWQEATRPLWDRFRADTGDLGGQLMDAAEAIRAETAGR